MDISITSQRNSQNPYPLTVFSYSQLKTLITQHNVTMSKMRNMLIVLCTDILSQGVLNGTFSQLKMIDNYVDPIYSRGFFMFISLMNCDFLFTGHYFRNNSGMIYEFLLKKAEL